MAATSRPTPRPKHRLDVLVVVLAHSYLLPGVWSVALEAGRVGVGLRLAAALGYFWSRHGYAAEGKRWLVDLLGVSGPEQGPERAKCLVAAADIALIQGDGGEALSLGARAVALVRESGDKTVLGWTLKDLGRFQVRTGRLAEARENLEEARALGEDSGDGRLVESAMSRMAELDINCGSLQLGKRLAEECVALCRASGNLRNLASALFCVIDAEFHAGNVARAVELLRELLGYHRQLGDVRGATSALSDLGICLLSQGDLGAARPYLEESLASQKAQGMRHALTLSCLARLHLAQGDHEEARRLADDAARELARRRGNDLIELAEITQVQDDVARSEGRRAEALVLHRDALAVASRSGHASNILDCLEAMATSLSDHGEPEEATVLWAAADHGHSATGMPISPYLEPLRDEHIEALRAALTGENFDQAWAEGQALTITEATDRALDVARSLISGEATGKSW